MRFRKITRKHSAGVTLIELMIACAIIGILAAIAYPSYQAQVRRGNRTEAKAELMETVQELEKCYTRYGAYNNAACNSYNFTLAGNRLSENRKYRVTFIAGTVTANTYILQAAIEPGLPPDPECGMLTIDQSGLRSRSGDAPIPQCW